MITTPTSVELSSLLARAHAPRVPIDWLVEQLGPRSFGLTFFVMGLVGLLPGASMPVGVLLAWPALQLVLGHEVTVLPRMIGRRQVGIDRLSRLVDILRPRLEGLERLFRPRWPELFSATRRLTGIVMLLLGLTMVSPVPFSQVVPALAIMLLAVAYMEEDGLALLVALLVAFVSLTLTAATVWGTVATIDWLDPATRP